MTLLTNPTECSHALKQTAAWGKELHLAYAWAASSQGSQEHWKALPLKAVKRAIIGIHFAQTEPYVLRRLHRQGILRVFDDTGGVFHPKLLLAVNGKKGRALLGSSNFTNGGFAGNTEVNVMITGSLSDDPFQSLLKFIDDQWKHDRAIEPNAAWFRVYEQRYKSRPKPPKAPKPPKHASSKQSKAPIKIKSPSDLRLSWPQYMSLLRQQEQRFQSVKMHVFDHEEGSWLQEVEHCRKAFEDAPKFKNIPLELRKLVAGWGSLSKGYFGAMGGAGYFKKLTATQPHKVGQFLDRIPRTGEVSVSTAAHCLNGMLALRGVGLGAATRLLSMKRPDLFFTANQATQERIQRLFGHRCDTTDSYLAIVKQVWSYPWFRASVPTSSIEERAWRARAALIDAVLYEPS